jgi:hypothetical protein
LHRHGVGRNTELFTQRNGKIVEVEVYFGWSIPHEAPEGGFVETTSAPIRSSHRFATSWCELRNQEVH